MATIRQVFASQLQGKALPNVRQFSDESPARIIDLSSGSSKRATLTQKEASRHLNAYGGKDDAIDWVMDCVRYYADAAMEADWFLRDTNTQKKLYKTRTDSMPDDGKLGPRQLYDLLEEPNPYMDYEEMMELLVIDLLLVGNAYWLKWRNTPEGKPLALYRLAPPYVTVIPDSFGVGGYEYKVPESGQKQPMKISPDDIIHFKLANPHSPYYGLGVIQGGGRPLDLELALTDHQASYYEKGTNPSMILQSERRVPKDVFTKLRMQLRQRYSGPRNAGDLMVLEAGLKATSLTASAADAAFAPITQQSRDRVFAMFRMSPKLLGIVDESAGQDKVADLQRTFDNSTMKPFVGRLHRKISRNLTRAWGVDYVIDYRYNLAPEDQIKLAQNFAAVPGVSVRQVLEFLDLPPTGDDSVDDLILNLPGENTDATGQGVDGGPGLADQPLGSEPGRPPKAENTAAIPAGGGQLPPGTAARRASQKALTARAINKPRTLEETLATLETLEIKAMPNASKVLVPDPLAGDREAEVDRITKALSADLADLAVDLERSLLDHSEGKAMNDIVKRVRNSDAWRTFRGSLTELLSTAAVKAMSAAAVHSAENGVVPDEDLDYEALAQEVVNRPNGVRSIVKTLQDKVVAAVKTAKTDDDPKNAIQAAIKESITEWSTGQANTIAMTEATHAYNEATLSAAEAAGYKQVHVLDGDEDDQPCIDANGATWTIEKARANRLQHPNCRRAFLPAKIDE